MFDGKRVIFVHGRASKPPADVLHSLWLRALRVGLADVPGGLDEEATAAFASCCVSAYWATAAPFSLVDPPESVASLTSRIEDLLEERRELGPDRFHVKRGCILGDMVKRMVVSIGDGLAQALTVKDNVAKGLLADVRMYTTDQYIADRMRLPLENALREAWDAGHGVCLLSHSMGTGIAYDVLWRFTHRDEPEYSAYRNRRVSLLVTMGSPLGDAMYQDFLFAREHKDTLRRYPANIDNWCNFSALGDVVCHDSTLHNDFHRDMREHGLLKEAPSGNSDYVRLYNPFRNDKGKGNPHKSYGYLVQPKLAKWVLRFLNGTLPS